MDLVRGGMISDAFKLPYSNFQKGVSTKYFPFSNSGKLTEISSRFGVYASSEMIALNLIGFSRGKFSARQICSSSSSANIDDDNASPLKYSYAQSMSGISKRTIRAFVDITSPELKSTITIVFGTRLNNCFSHFAHKLPVHS